MTRVVRMVAIALIALVSLAACGDDKVSLDPPKVEYGKDVSEMGMFVTDPRFTVATLPEGKKDWLLFDDIGELFKYRDTHADAKFQVIWMNDYHSEKWHKAEEMWFVESTEINTPMGWGIAAFAKEDEARTMADEIHGTLMTWEEADARTWSAPPAPMDAFMRMR